MPSHPERVRTASLPAGYQFGDASGYGWAAAKDSVTGTVCRVLGALGEDMASLRFRAKRGLMKKLGWFGYDADICVCGHAAFLSPSGRWRHCEACGHSWLPAAPTLSRMHDHNCGNMLPEGSTGCDCGAFTSGRDLGDER